MRCSNLLLHRFDEELGNLRGSELVPGEGGFCSREDDQSNSMRQIVNRQGIYHGVSGEKLH